MSSISSSSSASPTSEAPAHEVDTKSGLNNLFNSPVESVQRVERDMQNPSGGLSGMFGGTHQGQVLNLKDGSSHLVHFNSADGYTESEPGAKVTDASNMSSGWKPVGDTVAAKEGATVGSAVEGGGTEPYNLLTNNCQHVASKIGEAIGLKK